MITLNCLLKYSSCLPQILPVTIQEDQTVADLRLLIKEKCPAPPCRVAAILLFRVKVSKLNLHSQLANQEIPTEKLKQPLQDSDRISELFYDPLDTDVQVVVLSDDGESFFFGFERFLKSSRHADKSLSHLDPTPMKYWSLVKIAHGRPSFTIGDLTLNGIEQHSEVPDDVEAFQRLLSRPRSFSVEEHMSNLMQIGPLILLFLEFACPVY